MDKETRDFRFKQFTLRHTNSTMKVGTDAVLLGAWCTMQNSKFKIQNYTLNSKLPAQRVLDIGCGCGIISLMLAQRFPEAVVTGIDIDEASVVEARHNAQASPFADRLEFSLADVRQLPDEAEVQPRDNTDKYDLIVSNPPYHLADTLPPDERRAKARNAHNLQPEQLIQSAASLLNEGGTLALVLPMEARQHYVDAAISHGLHLWRECHVRTTPRKQPKRLLLQFTADMVCNDFSIDEISLMNPDGTRSEQYKELCREFYLDI